MNDTSARTPRFGALLVLVAALSACGGKTSDDGAKNPRAQPGPDAGDGGGGGGPSDTSLAPLSIGSRWSYRVTDPASGSTSDKVTTVTGTKVLDGDKAGVETRVVESVIGATKSVTYVEVRSDFALRHREETLQGDALVETKVVLPFSVRGPRAVLRANQSWTERYAEDTYYPDNSLLKSKASDYEWRVESLSDRVLVPAGSFSAVKLVRTSTASGKQRTTWWVPGVGKVKEDDAGYIEELTGYEIK